MKQINIEEHNSLGTDKMSVRLSKKKKREKKENTYNR